MGQYNWVLIRISRKLGCRPARGGWDRCSAPGVSFYVPTLPINIPPGLSRCTLGLNSLRTVVWVHPRRTGACDATEVVCCGGALLQAYRVAPSQCCLSIKPRQDVCQLDPTEEWRSHHPDSVGVFCPASQGQGAHFWWIRGLHKDHNTNIHTFVYTHHSTPNKHTTVPHTCTSNSVCLLSHLHLSCPFVFHRQR